MTAAASSAARRIELRIPLPHSQAHLSGLLTIPPNAIGLVVFAHGSGSSHTSPRNVPVARCLQSASLATALFDLMSRDEEASERAGAMRRFDIRFLRERLVHVIEWLKSERRADVAVLPIGLFGASTGGAAAIEAAAISDEVHAVVSRGGRPDLADPALLQRLTAPTLVATTRSALAVRDAAAALTSPCVAVASMTAAGGR